MKRRATLYLSLAKVTINIIAAVLTGVLAVGCTSSQAIPLSKTVAAKGQDVATAALSAYDAIDQAATTDQQQQLFLKAVTAPPDVPLPNVKRQDFSKQLEPRRRAYRELKKAYGQFQVLAESTAPADISAATSGVVDAVNGLSQLPDVSVQTKNVLSTAVQQLVSAQQQRALRNFNGVLAKLVDAYRALWIDDAPTWKAILTGFTESYTSGIGGLPKTIFDEAAVKKAVDGPYVAPIAVHLFELNLISKARSDQITIDKKISDVTEALDGLVRAHAALATDAPTTKDALAAVDSITKALGKE